MLQMGVDVTFGTAMVNTGVFVINTILIAAMTGRLSPLSDLWSAVKLKVRFRAALDWLTRCDQKERVGRSWGIINHVG